MRELLRETYLDVDTRGCGRLFDTVRDVQLCLVFHSRVHVSVLNNQSNQGQIIAVIESMMSVLSCFHET